MRSRACMLCSCILYSLFSGQQVAPASGLGFGSAVVHVAN